MSWEGLDENPAVVPRSGGQVPRVMVAFPPY